MIFEEVILILMYLHVTILRFFDNILEGNFAYICFITGIWSKAWIKYDLSKHISLL